MSWKEFKQQSVKRYTFEEIGAPGFWVEMRTLDSMPWGKAKRYAKDPDMSDDEVEREAEQILVRSIIRWNITDPKIAENYERMGRNPDEAPLLPIPNEDLRSLDKLPSAFIAKLHEWLSAGMQLGAEKVPTMSGQPS